MATRKDHQDRGGKSTEMVKRTVRLTQEENNKLNEILEVSKSTLRDAIADMIEKRYIEVTINEAKKNIEILNKIVNSKT